MSRQDWGRGNVYRRGKTYWIRYPDGSGKYRFESAETSDEKKAWHLLGERLAEAKHDILPAKAKERRRTVNHLLDALEKDYAVRQCDSAHNLISVLKPVREAFGERRASTIDRDDLAQYIIDRRAEGYAEASIGKQLQKLKQAYALQKAVRAPDFPVLPKGRPRDVLIAPAEQRLLLAALTDEDFRDMAEFHFATGWRGKEIRTLQWKYVRHDSGVIRLAAEYSKTDEGRDFPLVGKVAEVIARREAKRVPASPYVFHRRGRPILYRTWLYALYRAGCKAGLGHFDAEGTYHGVKPHDSRRSFITESVDAGNDPQTVMILSGHKSARIFDNYRRVRLDILARAVQRREEHAAERAEDPKVVVLSDRKVIRKLDNSGSELRKVNGEKGFN
jgi:site-specific recombinase XerD